MITQHDLKRLLEVHKTDILSLYLSTDPANPESTWKASLIWLKTALKEREATVPEPDKKIFRAVAERIQHHVQYQRPQSKSLVLFTSENFWEEFSLRAPVRNECWWGRPSLAQLEWLLEEHRPYGVVLVDSQNADFYIVHLDEIIGEFSLHWETDTSQWRRKTIMPPARARGTPTVGSVRGGSQRDLYEDRLAVQVARFWQEALSSLKQLQEKYGIEELIVGGSEGIRDRFLESADAAIKNRIIGKTSLPLATPPHEILQHTVPLLREYERQREERLVQRLLERAGTSRQAGVGLEQTLKTLQEGRIEQIIITHGLEAAVWECLTCGYVMSEQTDHCLRCHSTDGRQASVRTVLPRLRSQFGAELEIVHGEAAQKLTPYGGIGALWRY
jgi:peptide subunit release factor 1 (eRF1)